MIYVSNSERSLRIMVLNAMDTGLHDLNNVYNGSAKMGLPKAR